MNEIVQIKQDLKNYITESEKQIELWKNVGRAYKKDGSDFQSFARNFTNCHLEQKSWGMADDMELVVSAWTPAGGYVKDSISLKVFVGDLKEAPAQARVIKPAYCTPYILLTPSETEQAIADRIKRLEENVASYKEQFLLADKAYEAFKDAVDNALRDLKAVAGDRSTLYYACRDYMRTAY